MISVPPAPTRYLIGFVATVAEYCPFHRHGGVELVYHPSGAGVTSLPSGERVSFREGSLVLYGPGVEHDQAMTVGGEDHCIQVGMDKAALADFPALLHLPAVEDQYLCNELTLLAESRPNLPPIQQQGYDYRVAAMILRVFELAGVPLPASPATSADRLAEQACAIIRENYRQLPQIGSVAGMLGISPDYLRHVFAARYGMSPKHFLVLTRIARARDLLRHSCLPLKTVADLCGFGNERYLCTSFLATEGISPGAYRKAFAPASRGLGHDADRRRRLPARTTRVAAGTVPAGAGARPGITPAGLWPDPRTPLRRPRKTGRGCRP